MNENEQIIQTEYSEVMQKSYIDYAMSVIVARALPDVRDGLKPVQRRTLYDMYELGIRYDKPYRKCARIVGDTMGKYHPHGDSSIYDSLVVMSQEFKKGMPLIDGHGNFGSIEGDGAAAMRYTEARLEKMTQENFLGDLDKNVVDFVPNFDETEKEPAVLPVKLPNLLINGAEGIAVGMATSIPPHNLGEVIDAVKAYMKTPNITTVSLMKHIQGPDFPTGGIVVNKDELLNIYETGSGKIKLRGKVEIENDKQGKHKIIITEIPYTMIGANIGKFLNDVSNLVETKKTNDIIDISNQSSKAGIRIVLELRKNADTKHLMNLLYKKTRLEDTFGVNMLAVSNGRPETLGLKAIIKHNVDFQYELATRKYTTLLTKAVEKKEIQEGLIKACDVIDLIIEILRGSQTPRQAKECLMTGNTEGIKFKWEGSKQDAKELSFTERQTTAILEMRLSKLIGLEIEALKKEHADTLANIKLYEDILQNESSMSKVIQKELTAIKKEYAKPRKTVVKNAAIVVYEEKKIEKLKVVFLMDKFGYSKTVDVSTYERNKEAAETENKHIIDCMNTDKLCIFTQDGKMHQVKVLDVPFGKFRDKGVPIDNLSNYNSAEEEIIYINSLEKIKKTMFLFITKQGMMKKVAGSEFEVSKKTIAATKLQDKDTVLQMHPLASAEEQVVLQTVKGNFLRFPLEQVPEKKKSAVGVRGIKLILNDSVEEMYCISQGINLTISYKGREIVLNRLKVAKRDNTGTRVRL